MNLCRRCQKRKGKRRCPLFQGWLCPVCCGELREKENKCPPTCPFFKKHRAYQERRFLEKHAEELAQLQALEENLAKDDKLTWLAYSVEKEIAHQAKDNPELNVEKIIEALSQLKDLLQRGGKRIILLDQPLAGLNPLAEQIHQVLETCQTPRDILVPKEYEHYSLEEKKQVIDTLLTRATFLARRLNFQGKEYLANILYRLEKIGNKISANISEV